MDKGRKRDEGDRAEGREPGRGNREERRGEERRGEERRGEERRGEERRGEERRGEKRGEERRKEGRGERRKEKGERGKREGYINTCSFIFNCFLCAHTQAYTTTHLSRIARRGAGLAIWAASLDNLIISHTACEAFPHC